MKVTNVLVELAKPEETYLANCEVVIDGMITIRDVRIRNVYNSNIDKKELRVQFPSRKHKIDDSWYNIFMVSDKTLWLNVKDSVLAAYNEALVLLVKQKEEG